MTADEGGDPACWAHLFDDADEVARVEASRVEVSRVVAADLGPFLDAAGDGVHWTLPADGDLNANLVRLEPGHAIGEHVNDEVDVLVVVLAGAGEARVDGTPVALARDQVVLLRSGSRRSIEAGPQGLAYVTVHRRRSGGLSIGR